MVTLNELGLRNGTDKASSAERCQHNYLPFYEQFLAPLRDKPITLLEIGVDKGNSLCMWRDYFQRGKIVGMDCVNLQNLSGDRIEIEIGNQGSEDDLKRISEKHGPFDVIVDDAGHIPSLQVYCFNIMIENVKPGGFYILEDLIGNGGVPFSSPECTDYMRELASKVILTRMDRIESIAFSYGTSVTRIRESQ